MVNHVDGHDMIFIVLISLTILLIFRFDLISLYAIFFKFMINSGTLKQFDGRVRRIIRFHQGFSVSLGLQWSTKLRCVIRTSVCNRASVCNRVFGV